MGINKTGVSVPRLRDRTAVWIGLTCLALSCAAVAEQTDLSQLSIDDLMNVRVTSVGKREQKLIESAAAIYVITQEDILRSGVTSIPEALRMVPGLSVAQIDGNVWAISARGFNGQFANKLLVLIDGRSVYTPLYSGVYWEVQDLLLEDVDRIEVIRGPGATMWGANAVNGVINIITRNSRDTQGGLLTAGASSAEQRFAGIRYGARLRPDADLRFYTKYFKRDGELYPRGERAPDGWDATRGGFRADFQISQRDSVTWQGDAYHGTAGQHVTLAAPALFPYTADDTVVTSGGNLLGRWRHVSSDRSDYSVQTYFDTARREELAIGQRLDTFDVEFQHHWLPGGRNEVVWGGGYRRVTDRLRASPTVIFSPSAESTNLFSGFMQDEISFLDRRLRITLGSKFEHNDYTGPELQPTARGWFELTRRHQLWAAVSRAVRTPSQGERDLRLNLASSPLPDGPFMLVSGFGSRDLTSERLMAYEAGYRAEVNSRFNLDLATYYNHYTDITSFAPLPPRIEIDPLPPHLLVPFQFGNHLHADGFGTELAANVNPTRFWKITAAHTWLRLGLHYPTSAPLTVLERNFKGETPTQQFNVRSIINLRHGLEFDVAGYYVGELPFQRVPAYTRLDMRVGWSRGEHVEFSIGGQNLLNAQHAEFRSVYAISPTEVQRNVYVKSIWRF